MANPTREDTWLCTLSIDGTALGVWDKLSGGEVDSEESKYNPGGMVGEISLGGRKTVGNVTLSRYLDWSRDWAVLSFLFAKVGAGRVTIGRQPLDANGVVRGNPLTYEGTLKTANPGDVDSEGTDAVQMELECTIDRAVAPV